MSGEGLGLSTAAAAVDHAGNYGATVISDINIDRTPPAVIVSSPAAGAVFTADRDAIRVYFSVADNLDAAPAGGAALVQVLDKGSPRGVAASSVAVAAGQALDPMSLDDGLWRLEVTAADAAGNSTHTVGGVFEVLHDTIAPVTALAAGEPRLADGKVYISTFTPLLFSATDDMLLDGDGLGVGAATTYAALDGGEYLPVEGAFHIAAEGLHALSYYSVDRAGNAESPKSAAFAVDGSAPETSYSIEGASFAGGAGLYVSTLTVIGFSAVEPPSSGAASGLAAVFVADSTDTFSVYAGTFTAAEGAHAYFYYAADRLGNAGAAGTLALTADGTPPVSELAFSSPAAPGAGDRLLIATDTYLSFAAADGGAGAAWVRYSVDGATEAVYVSSFTLARGLHELSWRSADNVGNVEQVRTARLQAGASLLEVSLELSPGVINLKSEGRYVEARLSVSSAAGAGFDADSIRITRINDVALSTPIYARAPGVGGEGEEGRGKGRKDKDKGKGDDKSKAKLYDLTVKFDRQALLAALPADAESAVTVEGALDDGTAFEAEDLVRVINPGRLGRGKGGRWQHRSRARADIGGRALKGDFDISLITLYERAGEKAQRDGKAQARGLKRRGAPYEFGPEGTVFDEPVEIALPYEQFDPAKEKLAVAYWNPSSGDWEPLASEVDAGEKVVKAKVGHFSVYQVVVSTPETGRAVRAADAGAQAAGPSDAFVLGEVYVYPNPAKGGADPVFHIECGLADSVELDIYTISGREAHSVTLTRLPDVIDDGTGQSYAYEYAWRGHIPSGVYLYRVEARKGGQKLKKAGKFAVVR